MLGVVSLFFLEKQANIINYNKVMRKNVKELSGLDILEYILRYYGKIFELL